jgi:hypothetical protein
MTPNERAHQLISATSSLIDVIKQENAALAERRHADIDSLQAIKQASADTYETQLRALAQEAKTPDVIGETTQRALQESRTAFETVARENVNALRSAIELNNRLVLTIANSVERQRISPAGYTKNGAAHSDTADRRTANVIPASLNEQF